MEDREGIASTRAERLSTLIDAMTTVASGPVVPSDIAPPPVTAGAFAINEDRLFTIYGVTWSQYEAIRSAFEDRPGLRMTYLEGTLELMSPGLLHETVKKLLARLVEAYADEMNIPLSGSGSMTCSRKASERSLEPDESFCIGEPKEGAPDFAIEVVTTSGTISKLDVYRGLGVREVWFWKEDRIAVYWLGENGYEEATCSRFLPDLDITELASFISPLETHTKIVRAYRARLRAKAPTDR